MENIDDLIGVETQPIDLNTIEATPLQPISLPEGAIRNRAATTALLSDPSKMEENFNAMVAENKYDGTDFITQGLQNQVQQEVANQDTRGFMSILADPKVPMEQKLSVIQGVNSSPLLRDSGTTLLTNTLSKGSAEETPEAEDARINATANAIAEIYKQREVTQALMNSYAAELDSSTGTAMLDITSDIVAPFSTNILMATIVQNQENGSFWKALKAFADPGGAKVDIRNRLAAVPIEQRAAATQELMNTLSKSANTLFRSDNDFSKFRLMQELMQDGSYSNTDRWLDTLGGVLDLVGLGFTTRAPRAAETLNKAANVVDKTAPAATSAKPAVGPVQPSDLARTTGQPTVGVFDERIAALEAQKASMLGASGNQLSKGEVTSLQAERNAIASSIPDRNALAKAIQEQKGITSKAAKAEADVLVNEKRMDVEASLSRIDKTLDLNKEASTLMQRIADLEKEIAMLQKRNTPIYLKKNPLAEAISRIEMNGVARVPNPSSPLEIVKLSNPQMARDMHTAIVLSNTDDAALAATGVNRVQAIANNILPQVNVGGKVTANVVDIDRNLRRSLNVPESIYRAATETVDVIFSKAELEAARANVVNRFNDASGLTMRPNMGSIKDDGIKLQIDAVYGPSQGDFKLAQHAIDQAKLSMSHLGVTEDMLEILRKQGAEYVPVKLEEVKDVEGSYLVRLKTEHTIDPTDVNFYEPSKVKYNWLDQLPATHWDDNKSVSALVFDYASMLDPKYTAGMVVGMDKSAKFEKLMLDFADEYAETYNSLAKAERASLDRYLREANFKGIAFDYADLRYTRGFSEKAIEAVRQWRQFWDAHFYLENLDMVRTFNRDGWMMFKHPNAELFAKNVPKNSSIGSVYDADLDQIVKLSPQELDALYASGGSYARLRRPSVLAGETVEHIVVRNNAQNYLRKFNENDKILNYRDGYFQLQYKAARFVDEITTDVNGKSIRRAVAVAKDSVEASAFVERMNANAPPLTVYKHRADERAFTRGTDDWFDIEQASGRIAQRHRGKTLESADGLNHLGSGEYILDPVTSAIRAAKSISGRTTMRPIINTAKERFMAQYGHLISNVDDFGRKQYPLSKAQIGEKGANVSKEVGDARTTWNYINYMENGYINGMDNLYKQGMNWLAEGLGSVGLGRAERAAVIASEFNPAQLGKGSVFNAFIATHPLRQLLVQAHQGVRTFAYNPVGWGTMNIPNLIWSYSAAKLDGIITLPKGMSKTDLDEFIKFVDGSGMMQAVDKNSLVRGALLDAADQSPTSKMLRTANMPLELMRKAGFDAGERSNILIHMAAVFDKFKRQGKDLTKGEIIDEARSAVRAISYDMNAAGDMLYNQTAANMILQFAQVPHKAVLNYINRRIPVQDRLQLLAGDILFWGTPAYLISEVIGKDILPEDPQIREMVVNGLESTMLNTVIQELSGDDDLKMDWSSLAPADMTGFAKTVFTLLTEGPIKAIAASPAAQLFGSEGRVRDALTTSARFFNGFDDQYETPASLADVAVKWASISSGFSAATNAYFMIEMGKKESKYGQELRDNVSYAEAMVSIVGFQEASSKERFEILDKVRKDRKRLEDDIKQDLKSVAKYYQDQYHLGVKDPQQLTAVTGLILKRYADDPQAYPIAKKYVSQLLADPETQLARIILETSGFKGASDFSARLKDLPMKDQVLKERLIELNEQLHRK